MAHNLLGLLSGGPTMLLVALSAISPTGAIVWLLIAAGVITAGVWHNDRPDERRTRQRRHDRG